MAAENTPFQARGTLVIILYPNNGFSVETKCLSVAFSQQRCKGHFVCTLQDRILAALAPILSFFALQQSLNRLPLRELIFWSALEEHTASVRNTMKWLSRG